MLICYEILCSYIGKNLESDLRKAGFLRLMREIDGNDPGDSCERYLKDVSMYARGKCNFLIILNTCFRSMKISYLEKSNFTILHLKQIHRQMI